MHVVIGALVAASMTAFGGWLLLRRGGATGRPDQSDTVGETRFTPLPDVTSLDAVFARSHAAPAVVFLHDRGCPISRAAYRDMVHLACPIHLVDVQRAHDLSRALQERTGVRHESPQVLVLRSGRAVWSASHFAITAPAVTQAVRDA